ncbi:MAG TPA: hypothetical protein DCF63_12500 [Planctomycetaceae bacterium]|nr:hypothetical protein [Planctomycetaceae bacterium]
MLKREFVYAIRIDLEKDTIVQSDRLSLNIEVPILFIAGGVLLLIARFPSIPAPSWLNDDNRTK